MGDNRGKFPDTFWHRVNKEGGIPSYNPTLGSCWIWTGAKTTTGYGNYGHGKCVEQIGSTTRKAHRISFLLSGREIPGNLPLDHLCRVPLCVNPDHLEPVSDRTNVLRGETIPAANIAKTHCPQGHPYAGSNLEISPSNSRLCRTCRAAASAAQHARRKAGQWPKP